MLTGDRNLDTIILNKLGDKDLVMVCQVNKYADRLCKDQTFWLNRILIKFPYLPLEILNKYKKDRSWSEYYIRDLRGINRDNASLFFEGGAGEGRLDFMIIAEKIGGDKMKLHYYQAIRAASEEGHLDVVKYLVENVTDEDDLLYYTNFALGTASAYGHIDTVRYLVEAGADIHNDNDAAIAYASRNGYLEIVRYLVEMGVHVYDEAIQAASNQGHIDIVNYLIGKRDSLKNKN